MELTSDRNLLPQVLRWAFGSRGAERDRKGMEIVLFFFVFFVLFSLFYFICFLSLLFCFFLLGFCGFKECVFKANPSYGTADTSLKSFFGYGRFRQGLLSLTQGRRWFLWILRIRSLKDDFV